MLRCLEIVLVFLLCFPAFFPAAAVSQEITKFKYAYSATKGKLSFTWRSASSNNKFKFEIRNNLGDVVFLAKKKRPAVNVSHFQLIEGETYVASVMSLRTDLRTSSATKTKTFVFSTKVKTPEQYLKFDVVNAGGRSGRYYLPQNYRLKRLPAMILLHGSSVNGDRVASIFKTYARQKEFVIIAPDSVHEWGWEISTDSALRSADQVHIDACINEVLALPHIDIDSERTLLAGISAGGEVAAYLGSNDSRFRAFAVLHGGVDIATVGDNFVPVWLSTGDDDLLRTPEELSGYRPLLQQLSFSDVVYTEFSAAHAVPPEEREMLIDWWYNRRP